jgi:hypothetical protein
MAWRRVVLLIAMPARLAVGDIRLFSFFLG